MKSLCFERVFAKRTVICFLTVTVFFFTCILRVAVAATSDYSLVQLKQCSYRLKAADLRGTIYDRNMVPLTNAETKIIAAVSPTPRAVTAISGVLSGEALDSVLERLKAGKPVLCEVPEKIDCDGIYCTEVYIHNSSETPAVHLVGYTDSDSHGVTGLEKAYDELLYSDSEAAFVFSKSGNGDILEGAGAEIENDTSVTAGGVVSAIDINIQQIAENAALSIKKGAVVIADSENSKIRAMVSMPYYDCTNVAEYLSSEDSPLLNRALAAYNVGSVFKPCIAAAGIESGKGNFSYTCTGGCEIVDRTFKCHKRDGHGLMTLESGLANSCNTYFYNFAFLIGGEKLYNTASALGFGRATDICDGLSASAGSMPKRESLSNIAYLANFSIGQGELLTSPVSMLNLYCAVASDGAYNEPSVVEGTVKDGTYTPYNNGGRTRVMKKETAEQIRKYLLSVIEEGTGTSAKPMTVSAAGKTATAQTGKFQNGTEICEGWFCGFFPAESPKYTVVVFSENISEQSETCGEVFAKIADGITELEKTGE